MQQQAPRSGSVYDDDESSNNFLASQPGTNEHLKAAGNRAQGVIDNIDDLLAQEEAASEADKARTSTSGASRDELHENEANPVESNEETSSTGQEDGLYNPEADQPRSRFRKQKGKGTKSKIQKKFVVLIGSAILGVVTALVSIFIALTPFKLNTIVNFLEQRFYGTVENAVDKEQQTLFTSYVKKYLLPGFTGDCTNTRIDRTCAELPKGTGPVAQLYQTWRQVRIENSLYKNFGIEMGVDAQNHYYMRMPDVGKVSLDDVASGKTKNLFDLPALSRADVRANFKQAFDDVSLVKRLYWRFKIGPLLEKKYGIKRCVMACNFKDTFTDNVKTKKLAFKAWIIRRIVEPRSQTLGVVFSCLISDCDEKMTSDNNDKVTNGEPMSDFDRQTQSVLDNYATKFGSDKLAKLTERVTDVQKAGGMQKYMIQSVTKALAGSVGADISKEAVSKVSNIVGWVLAGLKVVSFLSGASAVIKHYSYVVNSASYAQAYSAAQTIVNEGKSGHSDATEYGSFVDGVTHGTDGEGAIMEASPLYQQTFASSTPAVTSFVQTLFPAKAYAADSANTTYKCDDGKTIYEHQSKDATASNLVCPEENLLVKTGLTELSDFLNSKIPGFSAIANIAGFVGNVVNVALGPLKDIIGGLADITGLSSLMEKVVGPIIEAVMKYIIPSPVSDHMSGARMGDMVIAGADVTGNASCQRLLGCQKLTAGQVTAILDEQQQQEQALFSQKPLFARLFDKDDTHSLVSQLSLALPSGPTNAAQSAFASLISNPFGKIAQSFSNIFSARHTYAASGVPPDAFGITQYGYPVDDAAFSQDPEDYWNQHCKDGKQTEDWNKAAADNANPETGMPENTKTNPCLLIETVSDSGKMIGQ